MKSATLFLLVVALVGCYAIQTHEELYEEAIAILAEQPHKYHDIAPLYTEENIESDLYIPQYSVENKDYEYIDDRPGSYAYSDLVHKVAFPKLEQAAKEGSFSASKALGEIYLFGNYSTKPDYVRSRDNFLQAIDIAADGYSYFILGYMHATGMFGEFEVDHAKANLYFQFGVENGNVNAMLALGYRYLHGIGAPKNCEIALFYYSRAAHIGIKSYEEDNDEEEVFYNIRLYDFIGGLYGNKISDTRNSIFFKAKSYNSSIELFKDHDLYTDGHDFFKLYFNALEYIDGDYFIKKNYTLAASYLQSCVDVGEKMYGSNEYQSVSQQIDQVFLSRCQALLGHMYMKGKGVERNYDNAMHWISTSLRIQNTSEALRDMGFMYERGLTPLKEPNMKKAVSFYRRALKVSPPSRKAAVSLAKLLLNLENNDAFKSSSREKIFNFTRDAAYNGSTEALYYLADFHQSGLAMAVSEEKKYSCDKTTAYYKIFMERLERSYIPQLEYAFEEFRFGNIKNALVGYSMAAEQGLEHAESTVAYLLYQPQPLLSLRKPKTFQKDRLEMAMTYLGRASEQSNVDATILLGDLHFYGDSKLGIPHDYTKAFMYYKKAFQRHSSHGSYNLAYMYEYGHGPNNTADYFLAKRYYDFSIKFMEYGGSDQVQSSIPINFALLRLRLKYLFNKKKYKSQTNNEGGGWLKAFKNLGQTNNEKNTNNGQTKTEEATDRQVRKSSAHHEGTTFSEFEEYDIEDYLVIIFTLTIFVYFFIRNIRHQFRGDPVNRDNQGEANRNPDNRRGFNFQGGNIEFHFFAI